MLDIKKIEIVGPNQDIQDLSYLEYGQYNFNCVSRFFSFQQISKDQMFVRFMIAGKLCNILKTIRILEREYPNVKIKVIDSR